MCICFTIHRFLSSPFSLAYLSLSNTFIFPTTTHTTQSYLTTSPLIFLLPYICQFRSIPLSFQTISLFQLTVSLIGFHVYIGGSNSNPVKKTNMNLGTGVPDSSSSYFMGSSFCFDETKWTQEENKRFEDALALFDKETPDRWHNVARLIPGKTVIDVINHYRKLEQDVSHIEAGVFTEPEDQLEWVANNINHQQFYCHGAKRCQSNKVHDHEKKKGIPWTEEEHRQFLLGLKKYGKGDWRNISRNFVTTRTPTQVASHAQKYFIRQLSGGKDKRRSSIHDITTVHLNDATKTHQFPMEPQSGESTTTPPPKPPHHHIAEARYQWSHLDQQVAANMAFNLPMVAPLHGSSSYVPQYGHLL